MPKWYQAWRDRHRHPASFALHLVAVPLIPAAIALALWQLRDGAWSLWWRPVCVLAFSYTLQWIGHRLEGNDMGEMILLKRALGRPYVAIAPRFAKGVGPECS